MGGMTSGEIDRAVHDCLAVAATRQPPYPYVAEYLDKLRKDPLWQAEDLFALQSRVIRALLERESAKLGANSG
jgi:hypothetical protein